MSYSTGSSWSASADNFIDTEKTVFKSNIGLVISTSLITAIYSYWGIDGDVNNAVNRSLLMALSTFISASITDLLQNNGYITAGSNNAKYLEGGMIPFLYYGISKKQFSIPDFNSQAIKTGVIASVLGELSSNKMQTYVQQYEMPATSSKTSASSVATSTK